MAQEPQKEEESRQGFLEEDYREEENWTLPTSNRSLVIAPRFLDTCKTYVTSVGTAAKPSKPMGVQEMQDSHGDGSDEMQCMLWLVGTSSNQSTSAQQEAIQVKVEGGTEKSAGGASYYEPLQRETPEDGKESIRSMASYYPADKGDDDDARTSKGSNSPCTTTKGRGCKFLSIWDFWANRCIPTPESARHPQRRRRPDSRTQASTECGRGAQRGTQTHPSEQASERKAQHHQAGRKAGGGRHRMAYLPTEDVREIYSTEGSLSHDQEGPERGDCRKNCHLQRSTRGDQEQNTTDWSQERGKGRGHRSGSPQATLGSPGAGRRYGPHSSRQSHEEISEDNRSGQREGHRTENLKSRMLESLKASRGIEGGYHPGPFAIRSRHLDEISEIDAVVFGSLISILCCHALGTLGLGILCLGELFLGYVKGIGREGFPQGEPHRAREWKGRMRWTCLFLSVCAVYSKISHSRFEQIESYSDSSPGKSWFESELETFDFAGRLCYAAFENSISSVWLNAIAIWIIGILGAALWLLFERLRETMPRRSSTWRQRISVCSRRRSVRRRLVFHPVKFSQALIAYCLLWDHGGVLAGNAFAQSHNRHEDFFFDRPEQENDASNIFPTTARGQKHLIFELWLHQTSWTTSFANYRQLMVLDLRKGHKEQIRDQWRERIDWEQYDLTKVIYADPERRFHGFGGFRIIAHPRSPQSPQERVPLLIALNGEERHMEGTIWVNWHEGEVSSRDIFDMVIPDHQCGRTHLCSIRNEAETLWPLLVRVIPGLYLIATQQQLAQEQDDDRRSSSTCTTLDLQHEDVSGNASSSTDGYPPFTSDTENDEAILLSLLEMQKNQCGLNDSAGNFNDHEENTELNRRIARMRFHAELQWQDLRQETERDTHIVRQDEIVAEMTGLANHRQDRLVRLFLFGIRETHLRVERLWIDTRDIVDFVDVITLIRGRWEDQRNRQGQLLMDVIYVLPQPTPTMTQEDGVSLICDFLPHDRDVPILITTQGVHDDGHRDFDTMGHRSMPAPTCLHLQFITGVLLICEHNAFCRCWLEARTFENQAFALVSRGTRLDIEMNFHALHDFEPAQTTSEDDSTMMQTGAALSSARRYPWAYGYLRSAEEPFRVSTVAVGRILS